MNTENYIHSLGVAYEQIAHVYGERPALIFKDAPAINHASLDEQSSRIANWLLARGMHRNDVACIFHDKSVFPYAIMLGCLKIGVVYTCVDTTSPAERVRKILGIASPGILFHGADHMLGIPERCDGISPKAGVWNYSDPTLLSEWKGQSGTLPPMDIPGSTPAYLMFTSGSTGFPKGVVISHQNVLNFVRWGQAQIGCCAEDVFTNINPMHFDNSVFDFYMSMFTGGALVPISDPMTKHPRRMVKFIEDMGCTIWFSVPSMLVYALRMRAFGYDDMPRLRKIIFGGEGFPKTHVRALHGLIGARVQMVNVYGPTECTCICSSYLVTESDLPGDDLLPLGAIAPNFFCHVIDDRLTAVQEGDSGELLIGGPNVGLGYYGDRSRTSGVFIQNPMHDNYRDIMYRSGDIVRWDPGKKSLLFCGRKDNQIKRMGYRIELEEIETALNALDGVFESACIYTATTDGGLIFGCVASQLSEEQLLNELRQKLPVYMIPNSMKIYNSLPKNQNGKIDRQALKADCEL